MEIVRTVRVPIHHQLTKRKLSTLDHLTARLSYCVSLFSRLIEERDINLDGYGEFTRRDLLQLRERTKLSARYIQQCRDQALWMWRSYRAQHEEWEQRLNRAHGEWRARLLEREPSRPLQKALAKRIPVRIDVRTGRVETSKQITLSPYVIRLSTMKKGAPMTIPLNPAEYHLKQLAKGRIVDFQLVKKDGKYHAHICLKHVVQTRHVQSVIGIDLGVRRALATVLLNPAKRICREDLSILRDQEQRQRIDSLNRRIAELQQLRRWEPLKRLRHKRRNIARYYDCLMAISVAMKAEQERSMVAVGYPKGIKYASYRGNKKPILRRLLQARFPYLSRAQLILDKCHERGILAEAVLEAWTSRLCHRCGSIDTRRPSQALFWCLDCGLQYNADWNSAINIGSVSFAKRLSRKATEGLAESKDELAHKPASLEVGNHFPSTDFPTASYAPFRLT